MITSQTRRSTCAACTALLLAAKPQRRSQLRFDDLNVNWFRELVTYLLGQALDLGGMRGQPLVAQRQRRAKLRQLLALRVRLRGLRLQRVQRLVRQACAPGSRAKRNPSCFVGSVQSQLLILHRAGSACSSGKLLPRACACAALALQRQRLVGQACTPYRCYLERGSPCVCQHSLTCMREPLCRHQNFRSFQVNAEKPLRLLGAWLMF